MSIRKTKDSAPKGMSKPAKFGGDNPLGRKKSSTGASLVINKQKPSAMNPNATGRSKMAGLDDSYKKSRRVSVGVSGGVPGVPARATSSIGGMNMTPSKSAMTPSIGAKSKAGAKSKSKSGGYIDENTYYTDRKGSKSTAIAIGSAAAIGAAGLMLKKSNRQKAAKIGKKIIQAPRNAVETIKENRAFKKEQKKIAEERKPSGGSVSNASANTKRFMKKGK